MIRRSVARARRLGSRWRTSIALGVATMAALTFLTAPPSSAVTTSSAAIAGAGVPTAARPSDDAATLRADIDRLLQDYIAGYGDRFTSGELRQLQTYRRNADRQLAAVVVATRRLEQATAAGSSLAVRRARGAAAQSAWRRAKSMADASFASAREILEPRLSLLERLSAARDYSTMMGRFDDLGMQIDAAAARAAR